MSFQVSFVILIHALLIPIYILLFITLYRSKKNLFILISILLNITCMIDSLANFLPIENKTEILCRIQSSIYIFGDLSKIAIATGFVIVAYLTFLYPTEMSQYIKLSFTFIVTICQLLPVLYGVICGFLSESTKSPNFCFIISPILLSITTILKYAVILSFYIVFIIFMSYFSKTKN